MTRKVNFAKTMMVAIAILVLPWFALGSGVASASVAQSDMFDLSAPGHALIQEKATASSKGLQSFAFDNTNGWIFVTQVMEGGVQLPGEPAAVPYGDRKIHGDMIVTKWDLNGNILGKMYLLGFGHGTSIGVEPAGTTDYLWTETDVFVRANGSIGGTKLARFEFVDNEVLDHTSTAITKYAPFPDMTLTAVNIDMAHGLLSMRYHSQSGTYHYALFDFEAFKSGDFTKLAEVEHPPGLGTSQGFVSFGSYLYLLTGDGYDANNPSPGNTYITTMNWNTGAVVDSQFIGDGSTLSPREPEGMYIQIPDLTKPNEARLCFGFTSSRSGGLNANIYYKDILITEAAPPPPYSWTAVDDSMVRAGTYASTNQAGSTDTQVTIKDDNNADYDREGYFKFDFSSYSGSVSQATIKLTPFKTGATGIQNEVALVSDSTWTESEIAWSAKPASGTVLGTYTIAEGVPITIDVTSQVQAAMSSGKKLSIRVYCASAPGSDQYVDFASSENTDANLRPTLTIVPSSYTWTAADDSMVRAGTYASTNQAGSTDTQVTVKDDAINADYDREGYFKFDFSSYSGSVSQATIKLTPFKTGATGIQNGVALVSDNTWTEGAITWNTKSSSSTVLGTYTITAGVPITIDVTSQVQAAMSSGKKLSIRVYCASAPGSDQYVDFASSENTDASQRPALTIVP